MRSSLTSNRRGNSVRKRGLTAIALSMVILLLGVLTAFAMDTIDDSAMLFQGVLKTPAGANVPDGNYIMIFRIFDDTTGGTAIWTETQTVNVKSGAFNVRLGRVTPLPDSAFGLSKDALPRFLQTTVSGENMMPRSRLGSVPRAVSVRTIDQAKGGLIDSGVFVGLNSTIPETLGFASQESEMSARAPIPCYDLTKRVVTQVGNTTGTRWGLLTLTNGAANTISLLGCSGDLKISGKASLGANIFNEGSGNFVAGGWNSVWAESTAIGGGNTNVVNYGNHYGVIGGGLQNSVNATYGAIGGGELNTAGGTHSVVPGGKQNTALGANSFAAGSQATATGDRSFVWNGKSTPFASSATPGQFLINSDFVGINTSSPARLLDVAGSFRANSFEMPTGAVNGYVLTSNASGVGTWQAASGGGGSCWDCPGLFTFLVDSTDFVGIGTSVPATRLHVKGVGNEELRVESNVNTASASIVAKTGTSSFDFLELRKWGSTAGGTTSGIPIANLSQIAAGATAGPLLLQVKTSNPMHFAVNGAERMRVAPDGKVGIATISPTAQLDVDISGTSGVRAAEFRNDYSSTGGVGVGAAAVTATNANLYGIALNAATSSLDATAVLSNDTTDGTVLRCFGVGYGVVLEVDANGRTGVNTNVPNSNFQVNGSIASTVTSTGSSLSLGESHHVVVGTSLIAATTMTLPSAVGITGREYTIKRTGTWTVTVATSGVQTIDGAASYALSAQYRYVTVVSNGSNWLVIGNN